MSLRDAFNAAQGRAPLDGFLLTNLDTAADPYYFGYAATSGAWVIKQLNVAAGTFYYSAGATGYAAAWTGRAGLTYTTPIT
jgi:hypothetical protein